MNLHHLKYFADAAREGGVSQSARKNHVTQSAVSRAIVSLESDLGVALVAHGRNHFQLTEAGEAVLERSGSLFESVAGMRAVASGYVKTLRGPLRFGCNPAVASRLIAPALRRLEEKHPAIVPELRLGNTDQIQRMIDERETDFGIVVDDGEVGALYDTKTLFTDDVVVVRAPGLKNAFENLLVSRTEKGGLSHRFFREYERTHGRAISPKLVVPNWQVILDLAIAGYGAALVPRFVCAEALRSKALELVPSKSRPVQFSLCAIVSRARVLPRNSKALFECIAAG